MQQQLVLSNGYLVQTAHFEEYYSLSQGSYTYIKDIETPILNISGISVRLHDERLDLALWKVNDFYQCLHQDRALLERKFTTTSPKGHTLHIHSKRELIPESGVMVLEYEIVSKNYNGPLSLIAILGGEEGRTDWYPLMNQIGENLCWIWFQMQDIDLQLCCAMRYEVLHNNTLIERRPIKIEKTHTIGYSQTINIQAGDRCVLRKYVSVVDSNNHKKEGLVQEAITCLTNL